MFLLHVLISKAEKQLFSNCKHLFVICIQVIVILYFIYICSYNIFLCCRAQPPRPPQSSVHNAAIWYVKRTAQLFKSCWSKCRYLLSLTICQSSVSSVKIQELTDSKEIKVFLTWLWFVVTSSESVFTI